MKQPQETKEHQELQPPSFALVPLSKLHESTLNPRRRFDEKALGELTESVRTHGVLTPLLARPNSSGYEIAAGHRRFRAATAAGLAELPVLVRQMSDTEFLEIVTIENLQREDVHPLDEALGYRALMDQAGYDVAAIAAKVGKSESYVYQRLSLLQLVPAARETFLSDEITFGHARLLAQIAPDLQERALDPEQDACFEYCGRDKKDLLSVSRLRGWIEDESGRDLARAPFALADAELLPAAGPCTSCPKGTGANRKLFEDTDEAEICLDRACYGRKLEAHIARQSRSGLVAISVAYRAKDVPGGVLVQEEYAHLGEVQDDEPESPAPSEDEDDKVLEDEDDKCEFREKAIVAHGSDYQRGHEVWICRNPKCTVHAKQLANAAGAGDAREREAAEQRRREAEALKQKAKQTSRLRAIDSILELDWSTSVDADLAQWLLLDKVGSYWNVDKFRAIDAHHHLLAKQAKGAAKLSSPEMAKQLKKWIADNPTKRQKLLVHVLLLDHAEAPYGYSGREDLLATIAAAENLDLKRFEADALKKLKADAKAKAAKSETKAGAAGTKKPKSGTKVAARETKTASTETARVWPKPNEDCVYEEKDCIKVDCREKGFTARILLVETEKGWIGSFEATLPSGGHGSLPGEYDVALPSQAEALCCTCETMRAWISARRKMVGLAGSKKALGQFGKLEKWVTKIQTDARDVQVRETLAANGGVRRCRVCGCTDIDCHGCIERTGAPCHWIAPDLCSACEGEE